jgi:Trk K+ transport system NAD-binding subunit
VNRSSALIFGFNKYAVEILKNVKKEYDNVKMYSINEDDVKNEEYEISHFDLSDNWQGIEDEINIENSIAFCILEDTAENIFLTISLRASYENLSIIAIASHKENANKLLMAGANKVIPLVETTADIITNMLENPISNNVLHDILYETSDLKIAQIKIGENSHFRDEELSSINWSHYNGIIVLSVMHQDMSSEFIYSSKAKRHIITEGDVLVVVGYETDIKEFEKKIGSNRYVNWSNWSW